MFSRDAITAAVASSCLLFMVVIQTVEACSCYEAIAETKSGLADEIWEVTIGRKVQDQYRGDSGGFTRYDIKIDKVIKSAIGFTDETDAFFKIVNNETCSVTFATYTQYLLAAGLDHITTAEGDETPAYVQICVKDEAKVISCNYIRMFEIMKKIDLK